MALAVLACAPTRVGGQASGTAAPAPSGVRTIYLLRHGQHVDTGLGDPHLGSGLSPLGEEQARMAAGRLKSLGVAIDSLLVSPLTRAVDTARPIADSLGVAPVVVEGLAECTPASWREDIMKTLGPGEADSCESTLDAIFARCFRASPERDSRLVLVCHGNVIRYLTCRALGVDTKAWGSMAIRHASITEVQVRPDGAVRLVTYADAGFQPPAKQTTRNIDARK